MLGTCVAALMMLHIEDLPFAGLAQSWPAFLSHWRLWPSGKNSGSELPCCFCDLAALLCSDFGRFLLGNCPAHKVHPPTLRGIQIPGSIDVVESGYHFRPYWLG